MSALAPLTRFCRDLATQPTAYAPGLGRVDDIKRGIVLCLGGACTPVLVGDPAEAAFVAEGVAAAVESLPPGVPRFRVVELRDVELDRPGPAGEFDARATAVLDAAAADPRVWLFARSLTPFGPGDDRRPANRYLRSLIAAGRLRVLWAVTAAEFDQLSADPAVADRLSPIFLRPPTYDELRYRLLDARGRLEREYGVQITDDAITAAIHLTARYRTHHSPLDLLSEVAVAVQLGCAAGLTGAAVNAAAVAERIGRTTGVPVGASQVRRLFRLDADLAERVAGQPQAVAAVAAAVRRWAAGLGDPHRPVGAFAFAGPSGTGKTLLAEAVGEVVYGGAVVRVDPLAGRLDDLVARVRRTPAAVVLLDDAAAAHPEVRDALVRVCRDGRLADDRGRVADFRNAVVVVTVRTPPDPNDPSFGFGIPGLPERRPEAADRHAEAVLASLFPPEFCSRLDAVLAFHSLTAADRAAVLNREIGVVSARLGEQGYTLSVTAAATDFLLAHGNDPAAGGWAVRRAVERHLTGPLAGKLLMGMSGGRPGVLADLDDSDGQHRLVFTPHEPPG